MENNRWKVKRKNKKKKEKRGEWIPIRYERQALVPAERVVVRSKMYEVESKERKKRKEKRKETKQRKEGIPIRYAHQALVPAECVVVAAKRAPRSANAKIVGHGRGRNLIPRCGFVRW